VAGWRRGCLYLYLYVICICTCIIFIVFVHVLLCFICFALLYIYTAGVHPHWQTPSLSPTSEELPLFPSRPYSRDRSAVLSYLVALSYSCSCLSSLLSFSSPLLPTFRRTSARATDILTCLACCPPQVTCLGPVSSPLIHTQYCAR
jgi:hypothetical protein